MRQGVLESFVAPDYGKTPTKLDHIAKLTQSIANLMQSIADCKVKLDTKRREKKGLKMERMNRLTRKKMNILRLV